MQASERVICSSYSKLQSSDKLLQSSDRFLRYSDVIVMILNKKNSQFVFRYFFMNFQRFF
jgi:hypothetical protein